MKLFLIIFLMLLVLIGFYYRVLQVALFALAAYHTSTHHNFSILPEAAESWTSVLPLNLKRKPRLTGTVVTFHPEYLNFNVSRVRHGFEEAAALNVEFVRTDVRWSAILPDGVTPDRNALNWYKSFFETARSYGLRPMIVLSSPPSSVRHLPKRELLNLWQLYIEQVVSDLGNLCNTFQILNEPNNPIYSVFDSSTLPKAVMIASQLIKNRVSGAKIIINYLADLPHWRRDAEHLLSQTGKSIDIVGIDHYPGTWAIGPNKGWASCMHTLSGIDTTTPGTVWYGRQLAIMETGFSTNIPWLRGATQQKDFYLDLDKNLRKIGPLRSRILFVGFYELCDSNSHAFLNPEAHFGLLMNDCATRKPAFAIAKQISLRR